MDESERDAKRYRASVWSKAGRALWRSPVEASVGERLADLVEPARSGSALIDPHELTDTYGDGGPVAEVERRVAEELGFPAAVFFPTGTMAQQVALRCWAGRTGSPVVGLHPLAHPEVHESGALTAVAGLRTVHLTDEPRLPTAQEVRDHPEPFGTLMLELPLRDAGFVLPTWAELVDVVDAARERDAVVHIDGARLWECAPHFGRGLREIAGLADSVYVSFYKSLGGISGAALAGPEEVTDEARVWLHRYGGLVFQQFPAALSALRGLAVELPRLPSYVAHARVVADGLRAGFEEAGVPWFRIHPETPHTHQFQVWLPYDSEALTAASLALTETTDTVLFRRWSPPTAGGPPGMAMTEVTVAEPGLAWTERDVREAAVAFLSQLA
ncbi:beta-eliminating lyase-related protein [Streptomyces sp. NPDC002992]|uniref:threonine aldolase family protein n=1 Tax=Streptomyces sp. NPDC002992 TaxID=3154273 RepID=UPI0033AD5605